MGDSDRVGERRKMDFLGQVRKTQPPPPVVGEEAES